MKRRNFLARTAIGALSSGVFAATGWLMGTGKLSMVPGPWSTVELDPCPNGSLDCGCLTSANSQCDRDVTCPTGQCSTHEDEAFHCCHNVSVNCEYRFRWYPCDSCPGPC